MRRSATGAIDAGGFGTHTTIQAAINQAVTDGYNAANKAACIYNNYLETSDAKKQKAYEEIAARCEELQAAQKKNANAYYLAAYALGRYGQLIGVAKALTQGIGGKVSTALNTAMMRDGAVLHVAKHTEVATPIHVELAGAHGRGTTHVDRRLVTAQGTRPADAGATTRWVHTVDGPAALDLIVEACARWA